MKKLLLPLLLVLLAMPVFAQASVVTFATPNGEPFQAFVNGRAVNITPANFVRIANLRPGTHFVEFKIRSRFGIHHMGSKVRVADGFETNYAVRPVGRSGRVQLRRISMIPLHPVAVVPVPVPAPIPPRYEERYQERPGYDPYDQCRNLLTKQDIDRLVESMRGRSFESTKQTIAREAVRSGSILSEDLQYLLQQFDHESTRLEFAKFAYNSVCDRERFYYVYDAFKFDSSIRELEDFASRRR